MTDTTQGDLTGQVAQAALPGDENDARTANRGARLGTGSAPDKSIAEGGAASPSTDDGRRGIDKPGGTVGGAGTAPSTVPAGQHGDPDPNAVGEDG